MKRTKKREPNVRERFLNELILIGGEVMGRGEAAQQLTKEGVARGAIDWCVYGVKPLTDEEIIRFAQVGVILQLRLRAMSLMAS